MNDFKECPEEPPRRAVEEALQHARRALHCSEKPMSFYTGLLAALAEKRFGDADRCAAKRWDEAQSCSTVSEPSGKFITRRRNVGRDHHAGKRAGVGRKRFRIRARWKKIGVRRHPELTFLHPASHPVIARWEDCAPVRARTSRLG